LGNLQELNLEPVYVGHGDKRALEEFMIPALHLSENYDRVAGYFSSRVFVQMARGLSRFIENGGQIRLVTSAALMAGDLQALNHTANSQFGSVIDDILEDIWCAARSYETLEERFVADHVRAMCWLLARGQLRIRLVVPSKIVTTGDNVADYEKFHPKFGLLEDAFGGIVAFSGSANETWLAWSENVENLSTYKSWEPQLRPYVDSYRNTFQNYWNNENIGDWTCIDLPDALRLGLLVVSDEFPEVPDLRKYESEKQTEQTESTRSRRAPRAYQLDAVRAWESAKRVGILEMATGTGKTFTARLCIDSALSQGPLLTVIVAPYQHIANQWAVELEDLEPYQVGRDGDWRRDLQKQIFNANLGMVENAVLIVVKNTAASEDFQSMTSELSGYFKHFLIVGDEVHWLGAPSFSKALNPLATFRLGLSATPDRYFDDAGTKVLREYFGENSVYTFGLPEALEWTNEDGSIGVLTPYVYYPIFVELTQEENEEYRAFSRQIAVKKSIKNKTREVLDEIERLQNLRSEIAKQAQQKIPALHNLIRGMADGLSHTLIYCANRAQMAEAIAVVRKLGVDSPARITSLEGASKSDYFKGKSEREHILLNFANGSHEVLFAIDCLDEGVDIPSAETAVILASSGNPKEFIQRRGRLMRKHPGKEKAVIYDMVVLPDDTDMPESLRSTELKRVGEFGALANNRLEIVELIQKQLGGENWTIL
jgi:superfamily II DNA or RNA helicase